MDSLKSITIKNSKSKARFQYDRKKTETDEELFIRIDNYLNPPIKMEVSKPKPKQKSLFSKLKSKIKGKVKINYTYNPYKYG